MSSLKLTILFATICLGCVASLALAGPLTEEAQVKIGMNKAFQDGLSYFKTGVAKAKEEAWVADNRPRVFSQYTQGLVAPGGGKPALTEQYRKHHYKAPVPVVVPIDLGDIKEGTMTAEQAAQRLIPRPPLQYTTDRLYV